MRLYTIAELDALRESVIDNRLSVKDASRLIANVAWLLGTVRALEDKRMDATHCPEHGPMRVTAVLNGMPCYGCAHCTKTAWPKDYLAERAYTKRELQGLAASRSDIAIDALDARRLFATLLALMETDEINDDKIDAGLADTLGLAGAPTDGKDH